MDINKILEIKVKYLDKYGGEEIIYRGRGLERLRKELLTSPRLKGTPPKLTEIRGEEISEVMCGNCGEYKCVCGDVPLTDSRNVDISTTPINQLMSQMSGYKVTPLNYTSHNKSSADQSPYQLAQQMRAEAEKQGLSFK
jgi:hypothetical protein